MNASSEEPPPSGESPTPFPSPADEDSPQWQELPLSPGAHGIAKREADLWSLVLSSRGVPHRLRHAAWGWRIDVPAPQRERALYEISRYREESRNWPPSREAIPLADNALLTLSIWGILAVFNNLTFLGLGGMSHEEWLRLGGADAGRILRGEWWRLITALTLHVDWQHLLANVLIGGVLVVRLCRDLGTATGWFLLLAAGAGGNLLNALLQDPLHRSVGASTAVFGAVGILTGLSLLRNRGRLLRRWPLPLAAGLALLALLGTGGERTDLGAHLFGFAVGVPLGMATARARRLRGAPSSPLRALWVALASALTALAWLSALPR